MDENGFSWDTPMIEQFNIFGLIPSMTDFKNEHRGTFQLKKKNINFEEKEIPRLLGYYLSRNYNKGHIKSLLYYKNVFSVKLFNFYRK